MWTLIPNRLSRIGGPSETNLKLLRRFYGFIIPHRRLIFYSGVAMGLGVILMLPVPLITMRVIDKVIPEKDLPSLFLYSIFIFGILAVRTFASFLQMYFLTQLKVKVVHDIRNAVLLHIQELSLSFFQKNHSGYLASRISRDTQEATHGLLAQSLLTFARDSLTFLGGLGIVAWIHPRLAAMVYLLLPLYVVAVVRSSRRVREASRRTLESSANCSKTLNETLAGIYVVQAFAAERREVLRNMRALKVALRSEQKHQIVSSLAGLLSAFISAIAPLIVIFYGGIEIIRQHLTVGQLIAFTSYTGYLFGPAERLINLTATVQTSLVAAERVFELLDLRPQPIPSLTRRTVKSVSGCFEFANVTFCYREGRPVLRNISLRVEAREAAAIMGRSGVGKTTLVNLLLAFYQPTSGKILLDGTDIREFEHRYLRASIGLVPQEPLLFSATIGENIRYGKPGASTEEIMQAARAANADEFIMDLEHGYDTLVGERGTGLSVGQKQRICIARAILKDPPLLILDEPTSSIDAQSETLIRMALHELFSNRTCLIISHRPSTIRMATRVFSLDETGILPLDQIPVTPAGREVSKVTY